MMDSGNSGGSMQSSSGGDEEYDSRVSTDSLSFFNQSGRRVVGQTMGLQSYSSATFAPISNLPLQQQQQPPPSLSLLPNHPPPTLFDPQPHSLASYSHSSPNQNQNQNPLYNTSSNNNLDLVWSRSGGPNYANPGTFASHSLLQPSPSSSMALPTMTDGSDGRLNQRASDQQPTAAPPKNSRKRTRASRRAPTTVLTTDTSNFRQMVQEFTGIPAQPFSAAASPYSRRLDLFGGGGGGGGGVSGLMRSGHLDTLGPLYPFRPSPQKFPPNLSPFLAAANASSNPISATNNSGSSTTSAIGGPSNPGYQTTPGLVPPKQQNQQSRDILDMQNPFMAYQSLFGSKSSDIPQELGMAQEQADNNLGAFQGQDQQIGLENVSSRNNEGTLESWICPSD